MRIPTLGCYYFSNSGSSEMSCFLIIMIVNVFAFHHCFANRELMKYYAALHMFKY